MSAEDKFTGESKQITNKENRILSQPELHRMALQAEKYREYEACKAKFEAKNGLVNYCFTLRFIPTEDCSRHVVGVGKEELEKAGRDALDALDWLDENQLAVKAEFGSCQPNHDEGVPGRRRM